MQYDCLIVGSGLYGATIAQQLTQRGKKCLVIEKRAHIGGNIYTEEIAGIQVHRYGAHIFHTNNNFVWNYVNQFAHFKQYINSPLANYKGKLYNLPFNMNTFYQMWGTRTPQEAQQEIERQRQSCYTENPKNLEQQALNLVGRDIYEKLIRGYTEKHWGLPCTELPPDIIRRIPVRFVYDNNYFNALYQGIPAEGYTNMVEKMLTGIERKVEVDYLVNKSELDILAKTVIYTGPIDAYFDYQLGPLEYRRVDFDIEVLDTPNFQGNAVINYTDVNISFTRIIEHKHFNFSDSDKTVISREYSADWKQGEEAYYPVRRQKDLALYAKYKELAENEKNVVFGGRLGEYQYYDMDVTIEHALQKSKELL